METTPIKQEEINISPAENQKGIENHKRAAAHFSAASNHHIEAAKHHTLGNHEKAARSTVTAQGFHRLATEAEIEDVKHHALNDDIKC